MLQYDPSAPALISAPYIGDEVLAKLRRPFWSELFSRWGNLFFIRDVRLLSSAPVPAFVSNIPKARMLL